eukprot:CAMPEP_0170502062 /NCGR_PEP_ID=MMETSP0208-20121228/40317_1 /TAXON_ID=197538 /ORGANISM="Strombidium inclinatum, Strain S3" /LENGTH=96 /DNA_ID=CAMNT_0010780929 /DNA_START=2385 /DNA_END=2672 /DNA_ORIENTATION=+
MILFFIEGSQALSVNDDDRHLLLFIIFSVEHSLPEPEALRAGVDRRADGEPLIAVILFQEQLIHQVGFASAVLAADGDHTHLLFQRGKEFCGLFSY